VDLTDDDPSSPGEIGLNQLIMGFGVGSLEPFILCNSISEDFSNEITPNVMAPIILQHWLRQFTQPAPWSIYPISPHPITVLQIVISFRV
jgi:hypothetical protein